MRIPFQHRRFGTTLCGRSPATPQPARRIAGLVALALLGALLAACGRTVGASPHLRLAPTPTLEPAHALAWRAALPAVSLIARPLYPFRPPSLAFAASDGNTAYECYAPEEVAAHRAEVWVTHDRGKYWKRMGDIITDGEVDSCMIVVDDLNPNTAVALTFRDARDNCPGCFNGTRESYVTFDGGATWAPESGPYLLVQQLATLHGVTYALYADPTGHTGPLHTALPTTLYASRDGMRTRTAIDRDITAAVVPGPHFPGAKRTVSQFWLNPFDGELLALTTASILNQDQLWLSRDGGQHWAPIHSPTVDQFLVQTPTAASQPWRFCGTHVNERPAASNVLSCSYDGGATWHDTGGPSSSADSNVECNIFALAGDGSVLETIYANARATRELRRLPPGGSAWQSLGPLPSAGWFQYLASGGILWLTPVNGWTTDAWGHLFTAVYP